MKLSKDWIGYENARNKRNVQLYTDILQMALQKITGSKVVAVLIGHHLVFEFDGDGDERMDIETENEIPSADCLMFDHDIMTAVFGDDAIFIMRNLATLSCDDRDTYLQDCWNALQKQESSQSYINAYPTCGCA